MLGKVKSSKSGHIPNLELQHPTELERVQRRSFFRLSVEITIQYRLTDLSPEFNFDPYKDGTVINLSAGGIKFSIPADDIWGQKSGSVLDIMFKLVNPEITIETKALILNSSVDPERKSIGIFVCRFLKISHLQKEAITVHNIRYLQKNRIEKRKMMEKKRKV